MAQSRSRKRGGDCGLARHRAFWFLRPERGHEDGGFSDLGMDADRRRRPVGHLVRAQAAGQIAAGNEYRPRRKPGAIAHEAARAGSRRGQARVQILAWVPSQSGRFTDALQPQK